jgi:hypothetical protein
MWAQDVSAMASYHGGASAAAAQLATLPAHAGRVRTVVFTPDGDGLISVGDGPGLGEVRLWSAAP